MTARKNAEAAAEIFMRKRLILCSEPISGRLRPNIRFGSVRFGNSAIFSRFGKVRVRFRLSEY